MSRLKIYDLFAYEIFASNGYPSIEVILKYSNQDYVKASLSYGASSGTYEAKIIFDNDPLRFEGKGMKNSVSLINDFIRNEILDEEFETLEELDSYLEQLDGTDDFSKLGANVILPISIAGAKAFAKINNLEIYEYLAAIIDNIPSLPSPMMVCIEGGKHADNSSDIQEYCITYKIPDGQISDKIEKVLSAYHLTKKLLKDYGYATNVGNEGAYAPEGIASNSLPIEILKKAILELELQDELGISIDAASNEFSEQVEEGYNYELLINGEKKNLTTEETCKFYLENFNDSLILSQEDFFNESDIEGWKLYAQRTQNLLIGDDLTVTNKKLLKKAIDLQIIDGIIIKPNQIGTVTGTLETAKIAIENNVINIVSHRGGGETNDSFISDLACAISARWIKCGPTRGERIEKYNRLLEIDRHMRNKFKSKQSFLV